MRFLLMFFFCAIGLSAPHIALADETRVALVIGNSRYEHQTALPNPENDARETARALAEIGYDVTVAYDLTRNQMFYALSAFGAKIRDVNADVAMIYYAGHGQEANGVTYLIPVDAQLSEPSDLGFQAVRLDDALAAVEPAARMSLVVVDICCEEGYRLRFSRRAGSHSGRPISGFIPSESAVQTRVIQIDPPSPPPPPAQVIVIRPAPPVLIQYRCDSIVIPDEFSCQVSEDGRLLVTPTAAEIAQRDFACQTDTGAQGVSFGQKCWPLDTTKIEWGDIPYGVRREITDASPLAGLAGLQTLGLSYTQVSDLTPLSGLAGLQVLNLSFTQVSDLTPLSGMTGLQRLYLSFTQVSDLTPLSGMTGLQRLYLWNTQVSDLTPLSGLTGLQTLDLYDTQVRDLTPLSGLTGLQVLNLSFTQVSDVTPLSDMTALQELSLWNIQVSDLTPLSGLTALHYLVMRDGVGVGGWSDTPENRAAVAEAIREAIRTGRPAE